MADDPSAFDPHSGLRLCSCAPQVYRCKWLSDTVAVKSCRMLTSTPDAERLRKRKELCQEVATLLLMLPHTNLIQVKGIVSRPADQPLLLIMELAERGSVFSLMRRRKTRQEVEALGSDPLELPDVPPMATALAWAADSARGMEWIHSQSVLHRDLKSLNLVVTKEGVVKVTDFGLAKLRDRNAEETLALTRQAGTLQWMAPEVIQQSESTPRSLEYGKPADVFSFGVILWELRSAEIPYKCIKGASIDAAIGIAVCVEGKRPDSYPLSDGLAWPRAAVGRGVAGDCTPPEYVALMRECWTSEPRDRPSFSEVLARLDAIHAMHHARAAGRPLSGTSSPRP